MKAREIIGLGDVPVEKSYIIRAYRCGPTLRNEWRVYANYRDAVRHLTNRPNHVCIPVHVLVEASD